MTYSYLTIKSLAYMKKSPRLWQGRRFLLVVSAGAGLACLSLIQPARAVSPPPDGGYANDNTAEGENALFDLDTNTSTDNTAVGFLAMSETDTNASFNTAVGSQAMEFGFQAFANTGIGFSALFQVSGSNNTGIGASALGADGSGSGNTGVGEGALFFNTNGNDNTCLGLNALGNTTGNSNIGIGESAGVNLTSGKNNIDIANAGKAGESAKIRIGNKAHKNTFIMGISGVTVAGGIGVVIDTNGQLGTVTSSKRFKEAIKPMDKASEALLSLRPVTFRYKRDLDPAGIPQFGLVAEDVAKVDPDLVAKDEDGKVYSVRYEAVNAMLLNEFLKEHRTVEQLKATMAKQEEIIARQEKQLETLGNSLSQVNNKIELIKSTTTQVVAGN